MALARRILRVARYDMALARRMLMVMYILLSFWMTTTRAHDEDGHGMKKMMKMSVYIHDKFNATSVMVARPPSKAGLVTQTEAPFGALFILNDPMTEGADPTSARLGNVTWTLLASTPDYGSSFLTTWILTFFNNSSPPRHDLHGLHGTLSASGISTVYNPQPQPISGGTGSFAFVVGSLTMVPIDVSTFTQIFRLDLLLYWPPYAHA